MLAHVAAHLTAYGAALAVATLIFVTYATHLVIKTRT